MYLFESLFNFQKILQDDLNFKTFSPFDFYLQRLISVPQMFFFLIDIKNAFILQGPKHEWICAKEVEDDKFLWLSVLQNAIESSMEKSDWI